MKLKTSIALTFTGLSALLMLMLGVFIYYYSYTQIKSGFYSRLYDRTIVAAQHVLEADEFSKTLYDEILRRYRDQLDRESDYVVPLDEFRNVPDTLLPYFKKSFLQQIIDESYAEESEGHAASVGITYRDNEGIFMVIVNAYDTEGRDALQRLTMLLILSGITGLIAIFFIGRLYASQVLKPLNTMLDKINTISTGNLHVRLPHKNGGDELAMLSKSFNQMLDRLETAFDIQRNFISNASHELKNPLTAILGETEIALARDREADAYRKSLEVVDQEAQRLEMITTSLLEIAKASYSDEGLRIDEVDVVALLTGVMNHVVKRNRHANLNLSLEPGDSNHIPTDEQSAIMVKGNEGLLSIALSNLIENACKFSNNRPVTINISKNESGKTTILQISDEGVGIPAAEMEKIFEPFYRAENVRNFKGFGLGLSLANRIIKMHEGSIRIDKNYKASGTSMIVELPLMQ